MPDDARVTAAIIELARGQSARVLALLARRFGDLDTADDAVQDALLEAVTAWPRDGVPENPGGWLYTVALRKGIDRIRRESSARRRTRASAPELVEGATSPAHEPTDEDHPVHDNGFAGDEYLRLMLLCCHPALDRDSQVALTLRLVGGLTTNEIAAAYVQPVATVAQRIVRAKRKIRDAGIPLSIPVALDDRVAALLTVLYLVFNESYLARGAADVVTRVDLADEAIRLTRQALELLPANAEVEGLLALELFSRARSAARQDAAGELTLLEQQDRSAWDRMLIAEGNRVLASALARLRPGRYQLQAIIAGIHANAPTPEATDWRAIAQAYGQLLAMTGSPVVALNHAVAVAMAEGPDAGLALIDGLAELESYYLFHAARGELLARAGRVPEAVAQLAHALELTSNGAERRHLARRIRALS